MSQDAFDLLLKTDLLGGVPEDLLRGLDPPPEWVSVPMGETLIEQGQEGEAFFLLVHGRLRVFITDVNGVKKRVGEVLPGEGVGEMSLLTDDPTVASIRAMHDCELVRFSRDSYKQLMEHSPEAALQITRTVIKRLRSGLTEQRDKLPYASIAILPIGADIDISRFVNILSKQLSDFAPVSIFNPDDLGSSHNHMVHSTKSLSPETNRKIIKKLMAFEAENTIVLYPADYEPTEWTRLCLRQADLVLVVSSVDSDPSLTEAEISLIDQLDADLAPRIELVLLHPEEWRHHCGTNRWLEPRKAVEFHHLRAWSEPDFARLARIVTGNAINLVLGGGGARGFSQIGVLRALMEAGVPIDRVAGTSMGSLIGALFAQGHSIEDITKVNRKIWLEGKPLSDYTFPLISILRGRRLHNLVKNALHDWKVEDLPITFFCVSSNLTSADLMIHDHGALWEGVRASGSLPGGGPPMFLRGNILVDGGVLNNLPGDLMIERFDGAIIAVDVSQQDPLTIPEKFYETPSGWRILFNKLNPFENTFQVPGIFEILYRTATLSSDRLLKQTLDRVDFLMVPPVGQFSIASLGKMEQIIDTGYRYAIKQLHGELDPRIARYVNTEGLPSPDG